MKKQLLESPALGSKGRLFGTSGHLFFLLGDKVYSIHNYDLDIRILSTDAIFREKIEWSREALLEQGADPDFCGNLPTIPAAIDYNTEISGIQYSKELLSPATGVEGILYRSPSRFRVGRGDRVYCIWHAHLDVEIIDEDAAFFLRPDERMGAYYDGILDYTSKSMEWEP